MEVRASRGSLQSDWQEILHIISLPRTHSCSIESWAVRLPCWAGREERKKRAHNRLETVAVVCREARLYVYRCDCSSVVYAIRSICKDNMQRQGRTTTLDNVVKKILKVI